MSEKNIYVLDHPLTGGYLKDLRDKDTLSAEFRRQVVLLGQMLVLEATRDLATKKRAAKHRFRQHKRTLCLSVSRLCQS